MKGKLKTLLMVCVVVATLVLTMVVGNCDSPAPAEISTVMTTELGKLGTQLLVIIGIVIAAAIPIVGGVIATKKGIGWFKGLAK